MMDYYVYFYRDPSRSEIIYVGKGRKNRAYFHLKLTGKGYFANYLRSMISRGVTPDISFIQTYLTESAAFAIERFWIAVLGRKDKGQGSLLNMTDGGEGVTGMKRSDETRQKMRDTWIKTKDVRVKAQSRGRDSVYTENLKVIMQNRWKDPLMREKVIAAQKARFATPESKDKRSRAAKEMWAKRKHNE